MSDPTSALATLGPELSSARPALLPGSLEAAADVLVAVGAHVAEAERRDGLTSLKRRLLARQRDRLALLADAARGLVARDAPVRAAIVARVKLPEPLGATSLARRERMGQVVAAGLPEAKRTIQRLALGDHVADAYERALDLRELASLYGRHGATLASVRGYELADEPAAFREAREILAIVLGELAEAGRLSDGARLWTLLEHGHAAAVSALAYVYGDDAVPEVPPL
ncbi:MAG: hypothetical protein U1F43_01800 [Myxococcota bacterium]